MNVEIISVGTEILLGDIVNSDAQILSKELANLGFNVLYHTVVGDNENRLLDCLNIAKKRADIIITTGGLGPTYDDLTKEIIAKSFNKELVYDKKAYAHIEEYFKKIDKKITENQIKQAMLPKDSTVFYNDWGTAPGCGFKEQENYVLMLPGPPRECEPMFTQRAIPFLSNLINDTIHSKSLKIIGLGEAEVEQILQKQMINAKNPSIAPYAKNGECLVRITAKAHDIDTAQKMIEPIENDIKNQIGEYIYGTDSDTLEKVVIQKLIDKNLTISCAESCTGGLLSKRITDVSGVSSVFKGSVCSYANEIKQNVLGVSKNTLENFGAVSEQTAREMAFGVSKLLNTDIGISITGVAGPSGGTEEKPLGLVYICMYYNNEYKILKLNGYRNRNHTRQKSAGLALDLIRRNIT